MSAPWMSHLTANEQAAIAEFVAYVHSQFPARVLAVTLYGSKARGDSDLESDIDLLVLVDTEECEFRSVLWGIASDISLEHSVVLSARVFAQARWSEAGRMRLPLYRAIVAEGIPIPLGLVPA